jgi:hypothetical protein
LNTLLTGRALSDRTNTVQIRDPQLLDAAMRRFFESASAGRVKDMMSLFSDQAIVRAGREIYVGPDKISEYLSSPVYADRFVDIAPVRSEMRGPICEVLAGVHDSRNLLGGPLDSMRFSFQLDDGKLSSMLVDVGSTPLRE